MESVASVQKVKVKGYTAGDKVVAEGAANDRFYVIIQGSVAILYQGAQVRVLHEGDVFGIEYYYLQCPYTTSAVCLMDARIASYHVSMIHDSIYERPQLMSLLLSSLAGQIDQTTRFAVEKPPRIAAGVSRAQPTPGVRQDLQPGHEAAAAPEKAPQQAPAYARLHQDILSFFIEESRALLNELKTIGESLKLVSIPSAKESARLVEFAQKLNRLIGGTASMGFEQFARLSRKTSLLTTRCSEIKELSIRIVISNLNLVVSMLAECFESIESIEKTGLQIPALESRLDICMTAIDAKIPDIKTQEEIDDIFRAYKRERA